MWMLFKIRLAAIVVGAKVTSFGKLSTNLQQYEFVAALGIIIAHPHPSLPSPPVAGTAAPAVACGGGDACHGDGALPGTKEAMRSLAAELEAAVATVAQGTRSFSHACASGLPDGGLLWRVPNHRARLGLG